MNPSPIELAGTILFALAVVHTFLASKFNRLAHKFPEGSVRENLFHFLGEVEVVFGLWAAFFFAFYSIQKGFALYDADHHLIGGALHYLENLNYTEPAFVFVIMCMAATKPIIELSEKSLRAFSKLIPLPPKMAFYITCLIVGPLLGSFITEPAAMTVIALILLESFYGEGVSTKFKYTTIGLLFVNVSIGGTLTHYAAPPVLMVAGKWGWGVSHMFANFGYKSAIACIISTLSVAFFFRKELGGTLEERARSGMKIPLWVTVIHLLFLALTVYTAHYTVFFLGLFLFFLGFVAVTEEYQDQLKLKESLLVGFFLAGLVTLGNQQAWWLQGVLTSLGEITLYIGTAALTGITDNAALTYLGSLVELSESKKYYLLAGAVAGGGLTVIANAPNPAGFGILRKAFGPDGISPLKLLLSALFPTAVALVCLQYLPGLY
ncbi:MAG: putative Na+/H+ antiporter [Bacteriovoracales bacterium]|nr:putative Na+/H+ antiporter [Bacteriovoracales bacterium]